MTNPTPARWRKSSHSGNDGACVEVASVADLQLVRDSKLRSASPVLAVSRAEFRALLADIQAGRLG